MLNQYIFAYFVLDTFFFQISFVAREYMHETISKLLELIKTILFDTRI